MIGAASKPRKKEVDDLLKEIGKLRQHIVNHVDLQPNRYMPHHEEVSHAKQRLIDLVKKAENDHTSDISEIRDAAQEALNLAPARHSESDKPPGSR